MDFVYTWWWFLLLKKFMIGSRAKLVLLTSFFTFAFAMLFLALVQNYAHAWSTLLTSLPLVVSDDIQSPVEHEIVPSFWVEQQIRAFDFDSDDSLQKYLYTNHPFSDTSYVPSDLIDIASNFTANNSRAFKLRQEASVEFADMAWHFRDAFSGDRLYISSAYRSRGFQDYLIKQWCSLLKCAQIGTSEHQAWLAIDLKVISRWGKAYSLDLLHPNKYYNRLKTNAATFGFHNTYQKWVEIDGKIMEWRHRRYLWTDLASLLSENDQTFAEYYNSTNN
jgi:hypothetical protein